MAAGLVIGGQNGRNIRVVDNGVVDRVHDGWVRGFLGDEAGRGAIDEPQLATPTPIPLPPAEALPYVERDSEEGYGETTTEVRGIICSFDWPQGCDYWIAIAACESSLQSTSISYKATYVGLYQVWTGHGYGYTWLLDPYNNTLAAWELSDGGTYTGAWPYCQWQ